MQETLIKLVEWVESASPELWRIAMKQAYVELWQTILGIVFCVVSVAVMLRAASWCQKKGNEATDDNSTALGMGRVLAWICAAIAAIIVLCLLVDLSRFLNMEYVAIQKLMKLAP